MTGQPQPRAFDTLRLTPEEQAASLKWARSQPVRPGPLDIRGKIAAGRRIAAEELVRHAGHHNDEGDALRHATWSRRMAREIGPGFSAAAGLQHELEASVIGEIGADGKRRRQPWGEAIMDMNNNIEGIGSALRGRPVDRDRLMTQPASLGGQASGVRPRYAW
jgi:hypothetical protein